MKKNVNWLVFLLTVVALVMVPALAGAQQEEVCPAPGLAIDQLGCFVLNPDGVSCAFIDRLHVVETHSANSNINITCHGYLDNVGLTRAEVFHGKDNPLKCKIVLSGGALCTSNWHEVITPSGNVTLTCHFKEDDVCPTPDPS